MTAKEAKSYLMKYRESLDRAAEVNAHLAELRSEAEQLKTHEGKSIRLDAAVARYIDACNDAGAYLDMLRDMRDEIVDTIERVQKQNLRQLLREIYIDGKRLVQIAAERNQSYEHICRMHGEALLTVSRMAGKE